jgi:hypothetical protein
MGISGPVGLPLKGGREVRGVRDIGTSMIKVIGSANV